MICMIDHCCYKYPREVYGQLGNRIKGECVVKNRFGSTLQTFTIQFSTLSQGRKTIFAFYIIDVILYYESIIKWLIRISYTRANAHLERQPYE